MRDRCRAQDPQRGTKWAIWASGQDPLLREREMDCHQLGEAFLKRWAHTFLMRFSAATALVRQPHAGLRHAACLLARCLQKHLHAAIAGWGCRSRPEKGRSEDIRSRATDRTGTGGYQKPRRRHSATIQEAN